MRLCFPTILQSCFIRKAPTSTVHRRAEFCWVYMKYLKNAKHFTRTGTELRELLKTMVNNLQSSMDQKKSVCWSRQREDDTGFILEGCEEDTEGWRAGGGRKTRKGMSDLHECMSVRAFKRLLFNLDCEDSGPPSMNLRVLASWTCMWVSLIMFHVKQQSTAY